MARLSRVRSLKRRLVYVHAQTSLKVAGSAWVSLVEASWKEPSNAALKLIDLWQINCVDTEIPFCWTQGDVNKALQALRFEREPLLNIWGPDCMMVCMDTKRKGEEWFSFFVFLVSLTLQSSRTSTGQASNESLSSMWF